MREKSCEMLSTQWLKTWLYTWGTFINISGNHRKFYNFEHFFQSSVSNRKKSNRYSLHRFIQKKC